MFTHNTRSERGFSLIELFIVVSITAIILAVSLPSIRALVYRNDLRRITGIAVPTPSLITDVQREIIRKPVDDKFRALQLSYDECAMTRSAYLAHAWERLYNATHAQPDTVEKANAALKELADADRALVAAEHERQCDRKDLDWLIAARKAYGLEQAPTPTQ